MVQLSTGGGIEIWMAAIEGEAGHPRLGKPAPFLQTPFSTIEPTFSPDGRWLAYYSHDPEKEGVWVVPFPGLGGGWLISNHGDVPIWSRNGRELFFIANSRTIMVTSYTARGDAFVFDEPGSLVVAKLQVPRLIRLEELNFWMSSTRYRRTKFFRKAIPFDSGPAGR
jgi:hypothetical protein